MTPPRSWSDVKGVRGLIPQVLGQTAPLHLPGSPELHRLIENHVICPPHPGHATALPSAERKIFPHYPKLHSAFRAPEKGTGFHFPGGGGPYSGTLIFPSVKGHADRAAGAAAEIR